MNDYDPINDHGFISLGEIEPMEDSSESRCAALARHVGRAVRALVELGFEQVYDALHEGVDIPAQPQFTAEREGRACCICLPYEVHYLLNIAALSSEQCSYCEQNLPKHDVYFAALVCMGDELYLLSPYLVRHGGKWLSDHVGAAQFLPYELRETHTRYYPLLGDASSMKLLNVVMPNVLRSGKKVNFFVDGLSNGEPLECERSYAMRQGPFPTLAVLLCRDDSGRSHARRPFFYYEHEHLVEMELIGVATQHPEDGLVELMTQEGHMFHAESLEAAALPGLLPTGRRYLWSLSLVASRVNVLEKELSFSEGAAYEVAKEDYLLEHGEEPPEDFEVRFSMECFRSFQQSEGDSDISLCGQVVELHEEWMFGLHYTVAVVRFLPDHDEAMLCVFFSDDILGDTPLAKGDTISCLGELYAAPASLVADATSWQDSPQLQEMREEEERSEAVHDAYDQLAKVSMGIGVAVSALVGADWELAEPLSADFVALRNPLDFVRPDGKRVAVYVDTIVDDHEPKLPCIEPVTESDAIYCRVSLKYNRESDRYHVSMNVSPEQPGVYCRLRAAASPMQHMVTHINDDHTTTEKWLLPEQLDEGMAAGLLRDALEQGDWCSLAEWLREEAEFASEFTRLRLVGKQDILRHLALCVEKIGLDMLVCTCGSILLDKKRRAALSISIGDEVQCYSVFDSSHGMIGALRVFVPLPQYQFKKTS